MSRKRHLKAVDRSVDAPIERFSIDDLQYLRYLIEKANQAELEKNNYLAFMTAKYKLAQHDQLDIVTGIITRTSPNGKTG